MNRYMVVICTVLIGFAILTGSNASKVSSPADGQIYYQNTTIKLNDVLKFNSSKEFEIISLGYDKKYFKFDGNLKNGCKLTAIKKGNTIATLKLRPSSGEDITIIANIKIG